MTLDVAAMEAWLCGDAVRTPDGAVWSWSNPAHPGYRYPEIAGLWLRAFPGHPEASTVARWLCDVAAPSGGHGRGQTAYLFDTAVVAAGLAALGGAAAVPAPTRSFLARAAQTELACEGPAARELRWSSRWAPHLLKCAIGLRASGVGASAAIRRLGGEARSVADGLRFADGVGSRSYLHAHLYALEGLMAFAAEGDAEADTLARAGARWTARIQHASGGLPAWHDDDTASGPLRADATAQALRVWAWADPEGFAGPMARAEAFLAALQHPSGALRYEPGSDDLNTWATLFALQGAHWRRGGASGLPW